MSSQLHPSPVTSLEDKPFYRGGLDDKKTTAPNGAVVNTDFKATIDHTWGQVRTITVRDGVHTVVGYAFNNFTCVEGKTGIIVFDTGVNIGQGKEALALMRKVTSKPVVAVIYSHHHYPGGTKVFVEEGGSKDVLVIGHPDVDKNLRSTWGTLGPMQMRRSAIQFGVYLPTSGPDAAYSVPEPHFKEPELNASGYVPVNHPVKDGEELTVDGVKMKFYYAVADTRDSLTVHFPDLDLVLHNSAITPTLFSLYTLRGDFYRDPTDLIASIDRIRQIKPRYLVGVHGLPITDRDEAYEIATAHRDAYAFDYHQAIRAINHGLSPDEMVAHIKLPKHLQNHPWLFPAYIDNEYILRGFYRGIVGWFAEDTADLHPPTPPELGGVIVEGFGGADKVIARANQAFEKKEYNLAAKLMSYVLAADPNNQQARQLKAMALRAMAQATRSAIQTRGFLLTEALHLEGKLDWKQPRPLAMFPPSTVDSVSATPPAATLKLLETKIDPVKSAEVNKVVKILFTDRSESYGLALRRGVAEFLAQAPAASDLTIEIPYRLFAGIMVGDTTLKEAIAAGQAKVTGSADDLEAIINSFDRIKRDDVSGNPSDLREEVNHD